MNSLPKTPTDLPAKTKRLNFRRSLKSRIVFACLIFTSLGLVANQGHAPRRFLGVVQINSFGCKSSATQTVGTVIGDGLVLTVAHGVAGQLSNTVTTTNGETLKAKVVVIDTEMDLAILSIQQPHTKATLKPINFGKVDRNSKIEFVIFQDSEQVVRPAKFKRNLRINTQDIYIKHDVSRPGIEVETKVVVGNSGGPLINEKGEIVGIIWSTSRTVKNRSWATRIEAAYELLSRVSTDNLSTQSSQLVACVG